ncbi:hypothetical protein BRADI_5g15328v3 [Brachypodium distachyon]|uniref:Uncharacterized protein n=1 Tax=Brachypodium distachyon TaxID=15368 RepID=A0A2K2CHF4_BRADI|nr:hypothetical protein BRADI_5g15328v3 [Brachypodium distachyon]
MSPPSVPRAGVVLFQRVAVGPGPACRCPRPSQRTPAPPSGAPGGVLLGRQLRPCSGRLRPPLARRRPLPSAPSPPSAQAAAAALFRRRPPPASSAPTASSSGPPRPSSSVPKLPFAPLDVTAVPRCAEVPFAALAVVVLATAPVGLQRAGRRRGLCTGRRHPPRAPAPSSQRPSPTPPNSRRF